MALLILGIILFIGLVIVHELGHFIVARRNGVVAEEFGIFFPPTLWRKKMKGGWDFTINALPLGGFVKLKGEHDADTEPGSFGAASSWVKTKIMLAGVFMNLITAVLLLMILALIGMPKMLENQFTVSGDTKTVRQQIMAGYIEPGSPAARAGLQERDELVRIKSGATHIALSNARALPEATKQFAGQTVQIDYKRNGAAATATTTLLSHDEVAASRKTNKPKGHLGIQPVELTLRRSTWSAPVVAVGLTAQFTYMTFQGLGNALAGLGGIIAGWVSGNDTARSNAQAQTDTVSGPVGIFVILKSSSSFGFQYMLFVIAIISLTLAIMNILPIPALDGGRFFIMALSRILKRAISPKAEEAIVGTSFMLLIGLIILITVVDVKRFF